MNSEPMKVDWRSEEVSTFVRFTTMTKSGYCSRRCRPTRDIGCMRHRDCGEALSHHQDRFPLARGEAHACGGGAFGAPLRIKNPRGWRTRTSSPCSVRHRLRKSANSRSISDRRFPNSSRTVSSFRLPSQALKPHRACRASLLISQPICVPSTDTLNVTVPRSRS